MLGANVVSAEDDFVPVEREEREIIIATFNVNSPGANKLSKVAAHIKLHDPDIVLLQECTASTSTDVDGKVNVGRSVPESIAAKAGYKYFHFAPTNKGSYGLGIVSKFPIGTIEIKRYNNKGEARINCFYEIKSPFGKFFIGNTHFPAQGEESRAIPYKSLAEFLERKTGLPIIEGGDLNTYDYLPSEKFPGFEPVAVNLKTCKDRRLDVLMYTEHFSLNYSYKTDARELKISDHDMVVASLTFDD